MIDYAAVFTNFSGAFPNTQAINVSAPGAGDGTEFVAALVNDIWGRAQALLDYAGLTPDGVTEAPDTAQVLTAIGRGFGVGPGFGVTYWKTGTPAANGDRVLLLQGQVVLIADYPLLVAATYVGDGNNATAASFYKVANDGVTRDTAGTKFVLPDSRAVSLKGTGNQTINTRVKSGPAFGAVEEDQFQGHYHNLYYESWGVTNGGTNLVRNGTNGLLAATMVKAAITDGTNGTPRIDSTTRDNTLGTNHGICY